MNIRVYQPNKRETLYDSQRDSQFAGVLWFNINSPVSSIVLDYEKERDLKKEVFEKKVEIAQNELVNEPKSQSFITRIALTFDRMVFGVFEFFGVVLFKLIKLFGTIILDFFVQFFGLLADGLSLLGSLFKKKVKQKNVSYFGIKDNEVVIEELSSKNSSSKRSLRLNNLLLLKLLISKTSEINFGKYRLLFALACLGISAVSILLLLSPLILPQIMGMGVFSGSKVTPTPTPLTYNSFYTPEKDALYPITDFRLVVPKINLESNIVDNVDPNLEDEYKDQLQFGVAHAKGSYLPPETGGPVYLFAHSTDSIFNIARFNAKFYSVRELEPGDEIKVYFNQKEYVYVVTEKFIINPHEVDIIQTAKTDLILQTCWPPGTDWQRLIVLANLKDTTNELVNNLPVQ